MLRRISRRALIDRLGRVAPGELHGNDRAKAARLLAVEILLAEPETLADDVLESCLYALRERLSEE